MEEFGSHQPTCKIPHSKAGLSAEDLRQLKRSIRLLLHNPEHKVGLQVRRGNEHAWYEWLGQIIDSGIGTHFWGADTARTWDITRDRVAIEKFMGRVVTKVAHELRSKLRKKARRLNKELDEDNITKPSEKAKYNPKTCEGEAREHEEKMDILSLPAVETSKPLTIGNITRISASLKTQYSTGFDKPEWFRLYKFICTRLAEPDNHLGLWEFGKNKEAWEHWFDKFLASAIGKDYLQGGKQKIWKLTCDSPTIIRGIMMDMVQKAAADTRNNLNNGRPIIGEWLPRISSSDESSTPHSDDSDSDPELNVPGLKKERIPHTNDEKYMVKDMVLSWLNSQEFLFHTGIKNSHTNNVQYETTKIKCILPLPAFLEFVRDKHKIGPGTGIQSLEVEICRRRIDIDLYDPEAEWSWGLVLGIMSYSGNEDGEVVYVIVHVD